MRISGVAPASLHCCSAHTCCVSPCLSLTCADVCPVSPLQAEFSCPLNPFLYPTDQLRGPPVLPEQRVSLEELQGQLAQATRLHQEERERFTNKIQKVNMSHGFQHNCISDCRALDRDGRYSLKELCLLCTDSGLTRLEGVRNSHPVKHPLGHLIKMNVYFYVLKHAFQYLQCGLRKFLISNLNFHAVKLSKVK